MTNEFNSNLRVQLHTLILLNIGGVLELLNDEWFGGFDGVTVHVIDSLRPLNLDNIFNESEQAKRIVVWDDGGITRLQEEKKSWEVVEVTVLPLLIKTFTNLMLV